ncbi:hypothetical protein CGC58_10315 [Capnocytophaga stomatis]|uniref:Uncharacterized protein n=1 Tax=Capnocytophaga stomatis TaxID=1848904 RepID=A0A250G0A3_9FLAO|nr:hypothetical protein CGC58_10315 [Capnocytophaga stomatis]
MNHLFLFFCLETKESKIQDFGYYAKNQFISLKISNLANAQTIEIFYVPFIDFLNASSPRS